MRDLTHGAISPTRVPGERRQATRRRSSATLAGSPAGVRVPGVPALGIRLTVDPARRPHPVNSPRAGRQQGSAWALSGARVPFSRGTDWTSVYPRFSNSAKGPTVSFFLLAPRASGTTHARHPADIRRFGAWRLWISPAANHPQSSSTCQTAAELAQRRPRDPEAPTPATMVAHGLPGLRAVFAELLGASAQPDRGRTTPAWN